MTMHLGGGAGRATGGASRASAILRYREIFRDAALYYANRRAHDRAHRALAHAACSRPSSSSPIAPVTWRPAPSAPEAFSAPAPGQPSPTQVWVGASAVCRVGFAGIRAGARGPPPPPGDAARFSTKSFSRSSTK